MIHDANKAIESADALERNKQIRKRNSYFKDGIKYKDDLTYAEYEKLRLCHMRHHNKETKDIKRIMKESMLMK